MGSDNRGMEEYVNGGEDMVAWCNRFVRVPVYYEMGKTKWVLMGELTQEHKNPATGKSYLNFWEKQQEVLLEALQMKDGLLRYHLIVLCWQRGEGKSFLVCLIQLWKFFCFPRQMIVLGANSKDQVKFVHYDIMRDIINHSPDLLRRVGKRNIQEKEIRLMDENKKIVSTIRSISSFSGIVSNITGYTFSEMFDMKNPKFFVQLDGSVRWIPNAIGTIDSTISAKDHVLYNLYQQSLEGKIKDLFFHYRFSQNGDKEDFWNPNMTPEQIDGYRLKFPWGEFERYFLNLWSAGGGRVFTDEMIAEVGIAGIDGLLMDHDNVTKMLKRREYCKEQVVFVESKGFDNRQYHKELERMKERVILVDDLYTLKDKFGGAACCGLNELNDLGAKLETSFAVMVGLDFGDPYSVRGHAKTVMTVIAKGLPGSDRHPVLHAFDGSPQYVYFVIHVEVFTKHALSEIKDRLIELNEEYEGIDTVCSERYGAWDMKEWCMEYDIKFEPVYPRYELQKEAFKEMYMSIRDGRFKCPTTGALGNKGKDIIKEEMACFDHDEGKKWFGSPEKFEKYGTQDDSMFALIWGVYGGRLLTADDFRKRVGLRDFGKLYTPPGLYGNY